MSKIYVGAVFCFILKTASLHSEGPFCCNLGACSIDHDNTIIQNVPLLRLHSINYHLYQL